MIDVSSAKVQRIIVHRIGNKLRDEKCDFSKHEAEHTSTLDDLLLKNYLAPVIKKEDTYDFYHESDLSLNTVHHFATLIFEDPKGFKAHSQSIAKHLYSASTHPNIGSGEFIVILFEDVRVDGVAERALGLFRIEGKDDYLDVMIDNGSLRIFERHGISLDKIQKGAIAISGGKRVYVVDSLSQKTKYWLDSFLKALPSETPRACARAAGAFVKAVSNKVTSPKEAVEFGQRLQEVLAESGSLTFGEIKNLSVPYLSEEGINEILAGMEGKVSLDITDGLSVDSKQLSKYAREVTTKARIGEGVHIVISNRNAHILSLDVKKTKTGVRATVDIQIKGG